MQCRSQGIQIDTVVVGEADPLLWRHIGGCPHKSALLIGGCAKLGCSEVQEYGLALIVDDDVGRLYIAMRELQAMDSEEGMGDVCPCGAGSPDSFLEVLAVLDILVEWQAVCHIHCEEDVALVCADIEYPNH